MAKKPAAKPDANARKIYAGRLNRNADTNRGFEQKAEQNADKPTK